MTVIFPPSPYPYKSYLPTAFDDSLTMLEKFNKLILIVEAMIPYFPDLDATFVDGIRNDLADMQTSVNDALARLAEQEKLWTSVNGSASAKAGESVYLKNDTNLFGYLSDGTFGNLATMEQNNIAKIGDFNIPTLWLAAMNYISLRAQNNPSFQLIDAEGNPVDDGRTLYHQGNNSYHLWAFASGSATLTKDVANPITNLTNINKVFPANAYVNGGYTIPRNGMYSHSVTVKLGTAPLAKGVIRVGIQKVADGVTSISEYADLHYDPTSYATPFLTVSFNAYYSKDDVITLTLEPQNENITIEEGTKLGLYILGDTIQA